MKSNYSSEKILRSCLQLMEEYSFGTGEKGSIFGEGGGGGWKVTIFRHLCSAHLISFKIVCLYR